MNQPVKLTGAQLWLLHSLETLFFLALITAGTTGFQAVSQGNYSVPFIAGVVLPAVLAVLAKGWSTSIQNNANFLQAILDTGNEVKRLVQQSPTVMPIPVQPQGPLVVVHTTQAPDIQQVPQQPSIRSLNAFPVPPRPIAPPPMQMPPQQPDIAVLNTVQVPQVPPRSFDSAVLGAVLPTQ